jgi:hypothetical protein
LVVNPGSPQQWEIPLRAGITLLGRADNNDFQVTHPSVSGSHCQITVNEKETLIRDLGSTNGTFVQGTPVIEAALENGQSVRLGDVGMVFYSAPPAPEAIPIAATEPQTSNTLRPPAPPASLPAGGAAPVFVGNKSCKFHPKTPARYHCAKCREVFCEACVALRHGGTHFCRTCGTECSPVQARFEQAGEQGFFQRIPGAFGYPLRGVGVLVVLVGIVLFALLKWGQACLHFRSLRMLIFGAILEVFAGGYLFTYLQSIIHATAAEERELPDLPGIGNFVEDVVVPFFRLFGLVLFCFGPALGIGIWWLLSRDTLVLTVYLVALGLGAIYFPMALLSVAIHDSIAAGNPLVVVPSILKVAVPYAAPFFLLVSILGLQYRGGLLLDKLFPNGVTTQSVGELVGLSASVALLSFISLYLLIVAVHLLALIYVTRKDTLGWLRR